MSDAGIPQPSTSEAATATTSDGGAELPTVDIAAAERLALIQQLFQQKQQELMSSFEQARQALVTQQLADYYKQQVLAAATEQSQLLQQQLILQQQQLLQKERESLQNKIAVIDVEDESMDESEPPAQTAPTPAPIQLPSTMQSLLSGSQSLPHTPTSSKESKEHPLSKKTNDLARNGLGGSQTISQHTKDRLKSFIANRRSGDSQPNLANGPSSSTHTPVTSAQPSWPSAQPMSPQVNKSAVASPHFEPYPVPSNHHSNSHLPEYQLRKVNSEPNLKMRIRSKILSKATSPTQTNSPNPGSLSRADSEAGGPIAPEMLFTSSGLTAPHMIMPSPSLPNLNLAAGTLAGPGGIDFSSLLAQAAQLNTFLSLPSLFKNQLGVGGIGGQDDDADKARLDPRAAALASLSGQLPIGGYPSLLKQQLRELVLRRKSLVREEPEEAAMEEIASTSSLLLKAVNSHATNHQNVGPKTGLAYDNVMVKHECVCGQNSQHVEHGGRISSIWERLQNVGLVQICEKVAAKKASLEALRAVHSSTYVTFFAVSPTACLKMEPSELPLKSFVQLSCGGIGVDSDTYYNDSCTQNAARTAAGSLMELTSAVADGKLRNGFAVVRPPGHHAEKDLAMGFCFFNNVAVAARHLQAKHPQKAQRIAIVDWDVHHGNGTQLCFEADPSVLYLSMHRHDNGNFFPGTGAVTEVGQGPGKGFTVNIPFSGAVMRDADYLAAWRVLVMPILEYYDPTFIFVSAGFDACAGHSSALGGYEISPAMFGYMTRQLLGLAGGRVVMSLEGGYALASISEAVEHCVKILCGADDDAGRLSSEALESIPCVNAQVIAIHKKHWPTLTAIQGISTSELHWQALSRQLQNMSV